jgi:hypothetical protein
VVEPAVEPVKRRFLGGRGNVALRETCARRDARLDTYCHSSGVQNGKTVDKLRPNDLRAGHPEVRHVKELTMGWHGANCLNRGQDARANPTRIMFLAPASLRLRHEHY